MKVLFALLLIASAALSSASGPYTVTCASRDFRPSLCHVGRHIAPNSIVVLKRHSRKKCIRGVTYFRGDASVIVTGGCDATFSYSVSSRRVGVLFFLKRCSSLDFDTRFCPVPHAITFLRVAKQNSRSKCIRGVSYGIAGKAISVSKGCRAEFIYGASF